MRIPNMITKDRDIAIRKHLLEYGESIPQDLLMPSLVPGATEYVSTNAFAFTLAASLDRGTKAEIIWTIPYWLRMDMGHLDPYQLNQMTIEQLSSVVARLPKKPRYQSDAPRTIYELSQIVVEEYDGDAELIWTDQPAQQVMMLMRRVHGVGEGIASMVVLLLERCRGIRFPDWNVMNVKPDVHVQRVLYRAGIASKISEADAIHAAVRLNPEYPGALDKALWMIGRTWCKKTDPNCGQCNMNTICARTGL